MRQILPSGTREWRLVALGFATAIAQAVLLREAMAVLGGSELAWGAVLTVWLVFMAVGARAGVRGTSPRLASWMPILTLGLALTGLLLMRALPILIGVSPGEQASPFKGLVAWVVAVGMAAFTGGIAFPLLAAGVASSQAAGRAYALESLGAVVGGTAFTFLLAQWGGVISLCLATACVLVWMGLGSRWWFVFFTSAVVLVAFAPLTDRTIARAGWRWSGRVGSLLAWRETREQRLELASGKPAVVYADGRLFATLPDPYRIAPTLHLAMLLHPRPADVLLVGGLRVGGITEVLRHPISRLDIIEEDSGCVDFYRDWLSETAMKGLHDPRVKLHIGESLRLISGEKTWHIVILEDGDPLTLRRNRTRTLEFFRAVSRNLVDDGVLVVPVDVGDTYLAGTGGELVATLAATLRGVFPVVAALPGERITLIAGKAKAFTIDRAELHRRWVLRGLEDQYFPPEMIDLLLDRERQDALQRFLSSTPASINTATQPGAVALTVMLREGREFGAVLVLGTWAQKHSWLLLFGTAIVVLAVFLTRRVCNSPLAIDLGFTIGFASMGWWLALLAAWQATVGSVYAEIGMISALFMAGIVTGSVIARQSSQSPHRLRVFVLLGGALVSVAIVAGIPLLLPRVLVPVMLLASGVLTGAGFVAFAAMLPSDPQRTSGMVFSADELGGACGALVLGLLVLPTSGMIVVGWVLVVGLSLLCAWVSLCCSRS